MKDAEDRFTNRVDDYVKYRPSYPIELIDFLVSETGLCSGDLVADVGSGTGIFTKLLLQKNFKAYAVEPNTAMREAAESDLKENPDFMSVNATAENTTLPDNSVELITSAQAFHWFDPMKTRLEFQRILKSNGFVALIWNEQDLSSPFCKAYEEIKIKYAVDYLQVSRSHAQAINKIDLFFGTGKWLRKNFPYAQQFDLNGLKGRLLSSSYVPKKDHPNFEPMMRALEELFCRFKADDQVIMPYQSQLNLGKLG